MECSGVPGLTSWIPRRRCDVAIFLGHYMADRVFQGGSRFFVNFKALNADEYSDFFIEIKALCDRARMISPNGPRQGILPLSPRQGWNSSLGP